MKLLTLLLIFNILDFGAVTDADCTQPIQAAIDRCAQQGGGQVLIPEGLFYSATIYLKAKVNLHLAKGAVLQGVDNPAAYQPYIPDTDLTRYDSGGGTANSNCVSDRQWMKALIIAARSDGASITGEGTIDGGHVFDPAGEEGMRGPHLIIVALSKSFKMSGVNLKCASNYAFLGYALENPLFERLNITEGWDGIHIRGCNKGKIVNCTFKTGDDSIAGGYWNNFVIRNCTINSSCNGIRIIMPCQNLEVRSCSFYGPGEYPHRTSGEARRCNMLFGISLEPGAWGEASGVMKNIVLKNLSFKCLSAPISTSVREGTVAKDLTVKNLCASALSGNPIPIVSWNDQGFQTIVLKNVSITR